MASENEGDTEKNMNQRQWILGLLVLVGLLVVAPPAQAQREGFIIGIGAGPGVFQESGDLGSSSTGFGLGIDMHIGGMIGDIELYLAGKGAGGSGEAPIETEVVVIVGIGATFPVTPKLGITGLLGQTSKGSTFADGQVTVTEPGGLGLGAGVIYHLTDSGRWALAFNVLRGKLPNDNTWWGFLATINVLSH